ncbi:MAG: 16S rRNA (cytosine(1402)-N(4))-methyltransferase RsmH [Candidatus Azotimanducaceae bacterium WSBS_2022_MAG_OTU7]
MTDSHQTVLLEEAVAGLITNPSGIYVDCTYGRGGHSQAIVNALAADGRLLVVDRDKVAIEHAEEKFKDDPRVMVAHGAFSQLGEFTQKHQLEGLDGVLLDLGVSSPQLDDRDRGFSFQQSGPLDMRMNQTEGQTAEEWLSVASQDQIIDVLKRYGEERYAKRIARNIVETRATSPINTTGKLVEICETSIPRKEKHKHPATRTFQAIRIQINHELDELETCLPEVMDLLNSGGKFVVISFHSLEDRIVKHFFRRMEKGDDLPSRLPIRDVELNRRIRGLGKPMRASEAEIARNRRARSSIMRIAEKL